MCTHQSGNWSDNWSLLMGANLTNTDKEIKGHELPHYLAVNESQREPLNIELGIYPIKNTCYVMIFIIKAICKSLDNNNNNNTYLKWAACNNQHKSQFFTAGPTIKRIDKIYYIIHVGIK